MKKNSNKKFFGKFQSQTQRLSAPGTGDGCVIANTTLSHQGKMDTGSNFKSLYSNKVFKFLKVRESNKSAMLSVTLPANANLYNLVNKTEFCC